MGATAVNATKSEAHAPVFDPVFEQLNATYTTSNTCTQDESYMTLLGPLGKLSYTTVHRNYQGGVDTIVSQFDDHGKQRRGHYCYQPRRCQPTTHNRYTMLFTTRHD